MVTIISATTYNRPDFISLQYNSIKKYVKNDFRYIVVNNAKFSTIDSTKNGDECFAEIEKVCKELNIEHHPITVSDKVLNACTTGSIKDNKYTFDSYACCYAVQWSFLELIPNIKGKVFIVDADLFFMDYIDLENLLEEYDTAFIPQFRNSNGSSLIMYMWNMFCGFDFDKYPELLNLNWSNGHVDGNLCDVGGMTWPFLKEHNNLKKLYLEEFGLYDVVKKDDKGTEISLSINGNINYILNFDIDNNIKNINVASVTDKLCENKSFYYEQDKNNYNEYLKSNILLMLSKIHNTEILDLPNPIRLGFVKRFDSDYFFALHYRSSANYLNYATPDYNSKKTILLKKLINLNYA
jgi:hypothetical protein